MNPTSAESSTRLFSLNISDKAIIRTVRIIVSAGIIVAVVLLLPVLQGGFFSDDYRYIVDNEVLLKTPWQQYYRFFFPVMPHGEYLPLRDLSYALDLALYGLSPRIFHFQNILLYVFSCCITWLFARRLARAGGRSPVAATMIGGLTAIFFMFHPAHIEAVAWISGRKDLLAGILVTLALWTAVKASAHERIFNRSLAACWLLAGLAMLAKTSALPAAASIFLIVTAGSPGIMPAGQRLMRALFASVPVLLLAVLYTVLATSYYSEWNVGLGVDPPLYSRIARAFVILGKHTFLAWFPIQLSLTHPVDHWSREWPALILGVSTVIASAIGVYKVVKDRSLIGLALAIFPIHLLTVLHIINYRTWSFVGERFLYIPTLFLAFGLAVVLERLIRKNRFLPLAASILIVVILAVYLPLFGLRAREWSDEYALLKANAAHSPGYHIAQYYVIAQQIDARHFEAAERTAGKVDDQEARKALLAYVESARLVNEVTGPGNLIPAAESLMDAHKRYRQLEEEVAPWNTPLYILAFNLQKDTIPLYERLLAIAPNNISLLYNQGLLLLKFRRYREAAIRLSFAVDDTRLPADVRAEALNNLGLALDCSGNTSQAMVILRQAMRISPLQWRAAANLARLDQVNRPYYLAELRRRASAAGYPPERIEGFIGETQVTCR